MIFTPTFYRTGGVLSAIHCGCGASRVRFIGVHPWLKLGLWFLPLAWLWFSLSYNLGAQWSAYEQYNYGWAVPFLCAYLFWLRWHVKPLPESPANVRAATAIGVLAAFLLLPTRFLHEANPIWRLTSLAWTLEVIIIYLAAVYLAGGMGWLRQFFFPIVFFLVAVPWPSGLENFLVQSLTGLNVTTTVELLNGIGTPALQHGNVIEVATGMAENQAAAKTGGKIARRARLELEAKTGKRVVTGENYLPPSSAKRIQDTNDE
ncbi:MAG: exosortase/archaeosortase family protein [Verrucomicrobia bacterium]|nr:exosortase/archaeosortase family protein [Verrucomicrobiota bacterium]